MPSAALKTGITVPYVEQGDPAGVPLVLLPGLSDSHRTYELMLAHLPASVRAFAVTPRGHGDADRPGSYAVADFAADVAAFLDAVGVARALVGGHSSGSYVAQRFALDHPQRCLGLVLIGAVRTFRDPALHALLERLPDPLDADWVREFAAGTFVQPVPQAFVEAMIAESLKTPADVWRATLRGLIEADVPTEAGRIDAPAILLWGDRHTLVPRTEQEALLRALPRARLVEFAGAGHTVFYEQPERTAAEIAAFAHSAVVTGPERSRSRS